MEEFKLTIRGISLTREELSDSDAKLLAKADQASERAYAPYSEFYVGVCVRLEDGTEVLGTNQENVAYPSGLCAERVALFSAATNYPNKAVESMAITVNTTKSSIVDPLSPCGNCRQVIMEYQHKQKSPIRLILASQSNKVWIFEDAAALLPFGFEADYLKGS